MRKEEKNMEVYVVMSKGCSCGVSSIVELHEVEANKLIMSGQPEDIEKYIEDNNLELVGVENLYRC